MFRRLLPAVALVALAAGILVNPSSAGATTLRSPIGTGVVVGSGSGAARTVGHNPAPPLTHGWMQSETILTGATTYEQGTPVLEGATNSNLWIQLGDSKVFIQSSQPGLFTTGVVYTSGPSIDASASGAIGSCGSGAGASANNDVQFQFTQITYDVHDTITSYAIQFVCTPTDTSGGTEAVVAALAGGAVSTTPHQGYYTYESNGIIAPFGNDNYLTYLGNLGATSLAQPIVGMSTTADGRGYWMVASDGGIFAFGDANFYGSMGGQPLNEPIVGMAATPDGKGYWMVASDGGIFAFGDATFYGSMGGKPLNRPIVGMAPAPAGGYWLVAGDGGVFSFGNAPFYGSTGNIVLNRPVVGMTPTPSGHGYWFVASDGGIFNYGDASFQGSTGNLVLARPVVGMLSTQAGTGYWLVASDGGIFSFNAPFEGSLGGLGITDVVGLAA